MTDADPSTTEEEWIRIRPGSSRSSTISAFYSAVDTYYADRSANGVQAESDQVDEDIDDGPDSGLGAGPDVSETDSGSGREADHQGSSDTPAEPVGSTIDGRVTDSTDSVEEQTGIADVESTSAERTESQSGQRESEHANTGFHFAPGLHSRGDYVN